MNPPTVFLTGAAGFIGSNTAEALLKKGYAVVGFDNLNDSYDPRKKQDNLKQIENAAPAKNPFTFFEGDLRDPIALGEALRAKPCDAIIHLGALAGVQPSLQDPQSYAEVNVLGTLHLLEAAKQQNISSVVFASSSSVYGKNEKLPFSETDPVDHPISPYASTKKMGELLTYTYHHLYDFNVACLRFFTVYGPRQRPDLAIYKFTRAMLKGEPITLYGDGSSSRDYTYIEDCVAGILKSLAWVRPKSPEAPRYGIFNLGESQSVPLDYLVQLLEKNLKVQAKKTYADYLPGDVFATYADLTHSKEVLGYAPVIKIEEGIQKFCEWYLTEEQNKPWARE